MDGVNASERDAHLAWQKRSLDVTNEAPVDISKFHIATALQYGDF